MCCWKFPCFSGVRIIAISRFGVNIFGITSRLGKNHVYSKYLPTILSYHTCPKNVKTDILLPLDVSKNCWTNGKQQKNRFHWAVLWKWINWFGQNFIYSKTSMTQTPMTHIPWLIRTCFWVPRKFFWQLRKNIFRDISGSFPILSKNVCCAYLLELLHWGSTNEYNQHTIIFKGTPILFPFVS